MIGALFRIIFLLDFSINPIIVLLWLKRLYDTAYKCNYTALYEPIIIKPVVDEVSIAS